ncbi:tripartite tricarboxylate transporter permease [uncultured Desulfuromusa sp.]|uniref:tripartite tricarboxylate transporter permease n=1 Tax=uncultured Desulfuromusa sp. TaxID=219183 RepID=UPI002AA8FED2|nr:tripartite tricarboxylate transporter permease [uncultured Desulfuromusa sp.]
MFLDIFYGFGEILSFANVSAVFLGLCFGTLFGAIPGLTATMGIALVIPLTFTMPPITAFAALLGAYKGGVYGGSIPAILINTPGTPVAAVTTFDGYPLAKMGKAGKAMDVALWSSVIADILSTMCLMFFAVSLAKISLKFGPPEFAGIMIFALVLVAGVSGDSLVKGILAASIGFLLGTIGLDPMYATPRYLFGYATLMSGIDLMVLLIGMFAISEVLIQAESIKEKISKKVIVNIGSVDDRASFAEIVHCLPIILKGTVLGILIGAIPGVGPTTTSFLNYSEARRTSKHPEEFGKGSIEGLAAAESGNNATVGGTLIPTLALGIPGDVTTAVLLGALMIHGLTPGPALFVENAGFVYAIFASLIFSSLLLPIVGKTAIKIFKQITRIPNSILFPTVAITCIMGVYGLGSSFTDLRMMLFFGVVAYVLRKFNYPLAPLLIGFILEPLGERAIRQSLAISQGSLEIFYTRPICLLFLGLTIVASVVLVIIQNKSAKVS